MSDEDAANVANEDQHDDGWDRGWEEHKRRQLIRMSKLTLAQKIQCLEDMQILHERLVRNRKSSAKSVSNRE